jgi:hypothetical protein
MARLTRLDFDVQRNYADSAAGILVPIRLSYANRSVELDARLGTGASNCIFDRHYADILGIPLESGFERAYRTLSGSFHAFGHELSIATFGLEWSATVFFYDSGNPANAFLGRHGWLDHLKLGLVHYERALYLGPLEG